MRFSVNFDIKKKKTFVVFIFIILVKTKVIFLIIGLVLFAVFIPVYILVLQPNDPISPPKFYINSQLVNDFAYQLQDVDIEEIGESKYDLIIIDYSSDGTEEGEYTTQNLITMKNPEEKLLLSYLSIGEAEDYRFYWQDEWDEDRDGNPDEIAPEWLDIENPEWKGNYKVKFWLKEWQEIIFGTNESYLDRIISQGFDGCYMDIIDAYEYYEDTFSQARVEMINFVSNISFYAKNIDEDFLIFVQNGEQLVTETIYIEAIDGIGREDVFYDGNFKNKQEELDEILPYLEIMLEENKAVLTIDYPVFWSRTYDAYVQATEEGFLMYVGSRALDNLRVYDFAEPD